MSMLRFTSFWTEHARVEEVRCPENARVRLCSEGLLIPVRQAMTEARVLVVGRGEAADRELSARGFQRGDGVARRGNPSLIESSSERFGCVFLQEARFAGNLEVLS
jgi:hypothetical protein